MRLLTLLILLLTITLMPACERTTPEPPSFQVALVTPGPVSDAGWNAAAYAGLERIGSELGAVTAHMEASNPAQFEESFRDFAQRGSALVFGHGFEFQDAAATVGAEFPGSVFVVTSGLTTADNVAGLVFRLEEAAYLAGVMAAEVSASGITGTVGGMEIPPVRLVFDGFKRGFLDTRSDGQVKEVFLGSWEDVAGARQATLSLIAQGADVVIHNADAAGLGVFQACRERRVLALGTNRDQAPVAPDVVLASAVMDIPDAMTRIAREVRDRTFAGGKVYTFDLASGVVELVINPQLENRLSPQTRAAIEDARTRLLNGEIELEHFGN
jgi:basic membrane lipoprotein Med (substrate-binding protein (PBP1-ABC) superfamily)